jgi:hypothetical protein
MRKEDGMSIRRKALVGIVALLACAFATGCCCQTAKLQQIRHYDKNGDGRIDQNEMNDLSGDLQKYGLTTAGPAGNNAEVVVWEETPDGLRPLVTDDGAAILGFEKPKGRANDGRPPVGAFRLDIDDGAGDNRAMVIKHVEQVSTCPCGRWAAEDQDRLVKAPHAVMGQMPVVGEFAPFEEQRGAAVRALEGLADFYRQNGDRVAFDAVMKKIVNLEARFAAAKVFVKKGDHDAAIREIRFIIEDIPNRESLEIASMDRKIDDLKREEMDIKTQQGALEGRRKAVQEEIERVVKCENEMAGRQAEMAERAKEEHLRRMEGEAKELGGRLDGLRSEIESRHKVLKDEKLDPKKAEGLKKEIGQLKDKLARGEESLAKTQKELAFAKEQRQREIDERNMAHFGGLREKLDWLGKRREDVERSTSEMKEKMERELKDIEAQKDRVIGEIKKVNPKWEPK